MSLVNFNAARDEQRGCFSLVFKARDRVTDTDVAIKIFDPASSLDIYRLHAFRREHAILEALMGVPGCLQLASGLNTHHVAVSPAGGPTFTIPSEYFATEWIDEEIDRYFMCQQDFSAAAKLTLFSHIVSAVAVLHSREVFHRDLKPDNIRMLRNGPQYSVVVIDLGTAASYASGPIAAGYSIPVGAGAYAAPESHCGLAGNRRLAPFTDLYALGCMLFELFNKDLFINTFLTRNPSYPIVIGAMRSHLSSGTSEDQQRQEWHRALAKLGTSFVRVPVDGAGSDIPPGVATLVNDIAFSLTDLDYRQRPKLRTYP